MKKVELNQYSGACQELVRIVTFYNRYNFGKRNLAEKLVNFYKTYGSGILSSFSNIDDVKLIFPSKTMETVNPEMVAKKALLYSGASLCVLPYKLHTANYKLEGASLFENFITRYSPIIKSGRLIPFPIIDNMPFYRKSTNFSESREAKRMKRRLSDDTIEGYAISSESIPIYGKEEELIRQINEDNPDLSAILSGTKRIYLPTLEGIDLNTLQSIMEDNGDPTLKYRYALKEMLTKEKNSLSEKGLLSAMEKTDLAIRDLTVEMNIIKSDKDLRQFEVFVGVITVGVSFLSPAWMSEVASKIFGSLSTVDGVRNLFEIAGTENKLKINDFYLPWLLSKENP